MTQDQNNRRIRSFVKRIGRMTESQKSAFMNGKPWLLENSSPINALDLFGQKVPMILDIGFGNGDGLAEEALAYPGEGFIGVEVHTPGVGHLLQRCQSESINNIRIIEEDVIEILDQRVNDASLKRVQIFFPDPWPKKRHHKRRLVQHEFLDKIVPKLELHGQIHIATDWEPYAEHCLHILNEREDLQGNGYVDKPPWRFASKFEQRGLRLGHAIFDLVYTKASKAST